MAWTTPKTWAVDELVTASDLNTHIRDNLNALKVPPTDHYELNEGSDYTTSSTSFVDVDATNLALTITTTGGDVLVHFHGYTVNQGYFDLAVDGSRAGGDDGCIRFTTGPVSFTRLITGLAAGEHVFKLQWKTVGAALTLYAGTGTAGYDLHPQFWVREI